MTLRRPTRLPDFPYVGQYRYSLRFSTHGRARLFINDAHVDAVTTQIRRSADEDQFAVLAYCFMPDHLHLVVEGLAETSDLRRFIKVMKQRAAYVFRVTFKVPFLWQEGYYERVLRSDEASGIVVRYVFANPVRAGLVSSPWEYPYSGGQFWSRSIA